MIKFITAGRLIVGLSMLNNINRAIEYAADRVEEIADTLKEIDNKLEVHKDENIYL